VADLLLTLLEGVDLVAHRLVRALRKTGRARQEGERKGTGDYLA
jgi:hypothetical protein